MDERLHIGVCERAGRLESRGGGGGKDGGVNFGRRIAFGPRWLCEEDTVTEGREGRGAVGPGLRVPARMVIVFSVSSPPSAAPHLRALRLRGGSAGDAGAPGRARPGRHGRREKKRK